MACLAAGSNRLWTNAGFEMTAPTPAEQTAYAHMQARLIALLLRHDQRGFRRFIDARTDTSEDESEPIRPYRELGVLFFLGTALFEDILPRIVRRLSFESPRSLVIEEPPARGRIHWERTIDATWAERPGEPPLLLHTRQRRRDFATSENLLTVATVIEYEAAIRRVLRGDQALIGAQALRHPLNDLADRCSRELAFPQFAGLLPRARRILDGADGGVAALEARVAARQAPGGNRAYQDLLTWRARWRAMQLLRRSDDAPTHDVLGADPQRDNYLYQLWIFYELADLLHSHGRLVTIELQAGRMALRFTWGADDTRRTYVLRHDQGVAEPVARWSARPNAKDVPGVRPDFYLARVDPPLAEVRDGSALIWREPGVVWDAKYYRERESERTPSSPVKRMIADLALLGETYGVLLFAFISRASGTSGASEGDIPRVQRLAPMVGVDQTLAPQEVAMRQLRPALDTEGSDLRAILTALLDDAHRHMVQPRRVACHGIFLDSLSAGEQVHLVDRYGGALGTDAEELLICPKPHIGPWRVDLVSRARHCCQDARLCHIVGQPGSAPPIRPPRTAEELLKELQHVFSRSDSHALDEEAVSAIARQVEGITRRFAEIAGVYKRIEVYYHRLRDMGLEQTFDQLGATERESLGLAVFLLEQLDSIGASDYSAPAIHISSVIEIEVQRRVFACPDLVGDLAKPKKQTLGVLPWMRQNPDLTEGNWDRIRAFVAAHWNEQIDLDDPGRTVSFDQFVARALSRISQLRNMAAHTHPLSRKDYGELQRLAFQGGPLSCGALNALLLAWHT
jgi:hypothetical protein